MANNSPELSDDILVSYADEELSEEEMARLKPLIESDAAATGKVEDFRRSANQLHEYFSAYTPVVTPADIARKIREMGRPPTSPDNVVSLASFRQRLSRGVRSLSSGVGLQKIAASLIFGIIFGAGGVLQFGDYSRAGLNGDPEFKFRGASRNTASKEILAIKVDGLLLFSTVGAFRSGSTIPKSEKYRVVIKTDDAEKVWLIYHVKNEPPKILLSEMLTDANRSVKFPLDGQTGIKFETNASFVIFEVKTERLARVTRKFYVFGIE